MKHQLLAILVLGPLLASTDRDNVSREMGSDYFTAGRSVSIDKPVAGDLFAAGRDLSVDAATAGDAVLAGGSVSINGTVSQHVYAAGGRVTVNGVVKGGTRLAGGEIDISPSAEVGSLTVAGGQVRVNGKVTGYLQASGGRVFINGPVSGDVEATANRVELGPNARISGKLRFKSREALKRDQGAQVAGGVEQIAVPPAWMSQAEGVGRGIGSVASWIWTFGLMLVIVVLMAALPRFFADAAETLEGHPGASALTGFVLLVCIPVAAVILLITGIGAPLGLLTVGAYLMLLVVGYLTAGAALGDWLLKRWNPGHAAEKAWRVGAAAAAVLAIALIGEVPWFGGLVAFGALLTGLGALALEMKHRLFPIQAAGRAG